VPFREFGEDTGQMPAEPPSPKEVKAIGKEATPKSERKGMSGEDFLMIGLGILSGQSPNALTNIGEGGLKGLQMVIRQRSCLRLRPWLPPSMKNRSLSKSLKT
jgi:hypothetical protein